MPSQTCPVCGNKLDFAPWDGGSASDEICPFCGIQFGYNDARPDFRQQIYREWRKEWIANNRQPFNGDQWREVSKRVTTIVGNAK